MDPKIITIIGGAGFLGRYVVRLLAKQGYIVRVITRDVDAAKSLKTAGDLGQVVVVSGNLAKPESIKPYLVGSYAVINLVGVLFEKGKQRFDRVHADAPAEVAAMAKTAGVKRFIQISALGVDVSKARYAKSKLAGERAVQKAFPAVTIFRPSIMFGPEDNFFNQFAALATLLPFLPLIGGGKTKFQLVYVGDVASAMVASLELEKTVGETYELAGPQVMTFKEILQFILHVTGRHACLLPIPFFMAGIMGAFASFLPKPPLTHDQVKLLKTHNIAGKEKGLTELGILPTAVDMIVPAYLARFRKGSAK